MTVSIPCKKEKGGTGCGIRTGAPYKQRVSYVHLYFYSWKATKPEFPKRQSSRATNSAGLRIPRFGPRWVGHSDWATCTKERRSLKPGKLLVLEDWSWKPLY
ncbi:hypothetical protein FKM82_028356 [Ascaphus truei]